MKTRNHIIFGVIVTLGIAAIAAAVGYHWFNPAALIPAIVLIVLTAVSTIAHFFFVGIEPTEATPEGEALANKQANRRYAVIIVSVIVAIVLLFLGGAATKIDTGNESITPPEESTTAFAPEESTTLPELPVDDENSTEEQQTKKPSQQQSQKPSQQQSQKPSQQQSQKPSQQQSQKPSQQQSQKPTEDNSVSSWWDKLTGKGDEATKPSTTQTSTTKPAQKPSSTQTSTTKPVQKPSTTQTSTTKPAQQPSTTQPTQPTTTAKPHEHSYKVVGKTITYERPTNTQHIRVTYSGDKVCNCGSKVKGITSAQYENHSFDSKGVCICGYKMTAHTHSYEIVNKVTDYERLNDTQHTKITYSGDQVCACGNKVAGKTTRTTENHSFDSNGKCACGYKKPTTTTPPTTEAPKKAFAFVSLRNGKIQETSNLSVSSTETVSIKLTNATAEDLKYYWTDPETGNQTSRGIELVPQGGGKYQVITSEELHECSVQIYFILDGHTYTLTCMNTYE